MDSSNRNLVMVLVVASLVAVLVGMALYFGSTSNPDQRVASDAGASADMTTSPSTTFGTTAPRSSTTTTATTSPPNPSTTLYAIDTLPSGLFCRDLKAMGVPFAGAVEYWQREGRSTQMDVDGNGKPCETVYSPDEVAGVAGAVPGAIPDAPGQTCRDLVSDGQSYSGSVEYWLSQGRPSRMDVDGNGRPCETAYSQAEVDAYWRNRG